MTTLFIISFALNLLMGWLLQRANRKWQRNQDTISELEHRVTHYAGRAEKLRKERDFAVTRFTREVNRDRGILPRRYRDV